MASWSELLSALHAQNDPNWLDKKLQEHAMRSGAHSKKPYSLLYLRILVVFVVRGFSKLGG